MSALLATTTITSTTHKNTADASKSTTTYQNVSDPQKHVRWIMREKEIKQSRVVLPPALIEVCVFLCQAATYHLTTRRKYIAMSNNTQTCRTCQLPSPSHKHVSGMSWPHLQSPPPPLAPPQPPTLRKHKVSSPPPSLAHHQLLRPTTTSILPINGTQRAWTLKVSNKNSIFFISDLIFV